MEVDDGLLPGERMQTDEEEQMEYDAGDAEMMDDDVGGDEEGMMEAELIVPSPLPAVASALPQESPFVLVESEAVEGHVEEAIMDSPVVESGGGVLPPGDDGAAAAPEEDDVEVEGDGGGDDPLLGEGRDEGEEEEGGAGEEEEHQEVVDPGSEALEGAGEASQFQDEGGVADVTNPIPSSAVTMVAGPSTSTPPPLPAPATPIPAAHSPAQDDEEYYDDDEYIDDVDDEETIDAVHMIPTASALPSIIIHLPTLGARALFEPLHEDPAGGHLPVWMKSKGEEMAEKSLKEVWVGIRAEAVREGLVGGAPEAAEVGKPGESSPGVGREMVLSEKMMELRMGEDDSNLETITLLDLLRLHHGCGLAPPVQLYMTFEPSRFKARYEAIKNEVDRELERRKGLGHVEQEGAEAYEGEEGEEEEYGDEGEEEAEGEGEGEDEAVEPEAVQTQGPDKKEFPKHVEGQSQAGIPKAEANVNVAHTAPETLEKKPEYAYPNAELASSQPTGPMVVHGTTTITPTRPAAPKEVPPNASVIPATQPVTVEEAEEGKEAEEGNDGVVDADEEGGGDGVEVRAAEETTTTTTTDPTSTDMSDMASSAPSFLTTGEGALPIAQIIEAPPLSATTAPTPAAVDPSVLAAISESAEVSQPVDEVEAAVAAVTDEVPKDELALMEEKGEVPVTDEAARGTSAPAMGTAVNEVVPRLEDVEKLDVLAEERDAEGAAVDEEEEDQLEEGEEYAEYEDGGAGEVDGRNDLAEPADAGAEEAFDEDEEVEEAYEKDTGDGVDEIIERAEKDANLTGDEGGEAALPAEDEAYEDGDGEYYDDEEEGEEEDYAEDADLTASGEAAKSLPSPPITPAEARSPASTIKGDTLEAVEGGEEGAEDAEEGNEETLDASNPAPDAEAESSRKRSFEDETGEEDDLTTVESKRARTSPSDL